jgi:hypothetical protein
MQMVTENMGRFDVLYWTHLLSFGVSFWESMGRHKISQTGTMEYANRVCSQKNLHISGRLNSV